MKSVPKVHTLNLQFVFMSYWETMGIWESRTKLEEVGPFDEFLVVSCLGICSFSLYSLESTHRASARYCDVFSRHVRPCIEFSGARSYTNTSFLQAVSELCSVALLKEITYILPLTILTQSCQCCGPMVCILSIVF